MITAEEEVATNQPVESASVSAGISTVSAPTLEDAEGRVAITLRCFVRQARSDCYIAECVDLDISVEAMTLESAISSLRDAMIGYLHVVLDGQDTDAVASLMRPSPLNHRIRYYFEYLKCMAFASLNRPQGRPRKKFYDFSPSPRLIRSHCCM